MDRQDDVIRLPKNICQIGAEDEHFKIYFEDYVNVFLRKAEGQSRPMAGFFLGKSMVSGGIHYLFISGAVLAEDVEISGNSVRFSEKTWTSLAEISGKYFTEMAVCGWFLCRDSMGDPDLYTLQKSHRAVFKERHQICCICENGERGIYAFGTDRVESAAGYFIYYERNPQMQEYMMISSLANRIEAAVEGRTAGKNTGEIKKAVSQSSKKKAVKKRKNAMFGTGSAAAVLVMAAGITWLYGRDSLPANATVASETTTEAVTTGESLIIHTIEGNVYPTESLESLTETETTTEAGTSEETDNGQEVMATISNNTTTAATTTAIETTTEAATTPETTTSPSTEAATTTAAATEAKTTEAEAESAAAPVQIEYYVVAKGDSLRSIVERIYGYVDEGIVEEICEINGLDDPDFIYWGQRLILP